MPPALFLESVDHVAQVPFAPLFRSHCEEQRHVLTYAEGDGVEALAAEERQQLTVSPQIAEVLEAMPSKVVLVKARLRRYVGRCWAEHAR